MLRDADDLLVPAVRETLGALDVQAEDAAAVRLALRYAKTIDDHLDADGQHDYAWAVRWIGPLLIDALEQLGATPAARARLKTGKTTEAPVGQLAKIRAARRA